MPKPDLRAELEAMAEGRRLADVFANANGAVIEADVVSRNERDFIAWARFAQPHAGEPLAAPSEILAPLP
jgi:hypothetical protein